MHQQVIANITIGSSRGSTNKQEIFLTIVYVNFKFTSCNDKYYINNTEKFI